MAVKNVTRPRQITIDDPDYDEAYTSLRYPVLNDPDNTTKTDNSLQSDISYWVKSGIKGKLICYPMNHIQTMVLPAI